MVRGSCPVLSPFLGWLPGSSELDWSLVELLRTYEVRFSASGCALHPGLCLGWALWGIPCYVFSWLSFLEGGVGCPLLSSRVLWRRFRPLLCSSVCGLHCIGPTNARQSQWETVISCAYGQVLPGPLGLRIVSNASGSFLPQGGT